MASKSRNYNSSMIRHFTKEGLKTNFESRKKLEKPTLYKFHHNNRPPNTGTLKAVYKHPNGINNGIIIRMPDKTLFSTFSRRITNVTRPTAGFEVGIKKRLPWNTASKIDNYLNSNNIKKTKNTKKTKNGKRKREVNS
jgi:hypothetical protein